MKVYFVEEESWDGGTFSQSTRTIVGVWSTLELARKNVKERKEKLPPKMHTWSSEPSFSILGPFEVDKALKGL